jgi:hypothetical protein
LLLIIIKPIERSQYGDLAVSFMFLSIVINALAASCCYCTLGFKRPRQHDHLILVALLITLIADLFLTFLGGRFMIPGVICFCAAETVYAIFLKSSRLSVILRAILFAGLFVGAVLTKNLSVLNVLAILNIAILFMNVVDAWTSKRFDPGWLFRLGITLFFCCDMSVGLSVLLNGAVGRFFTFMIWVFYIPSQVLLTLRYLFGITRRADEAQNASQDLTDT